jgi:integrase
MLTAKNVFSLPAPDSGQKDYFDSDGPVSGFSVRVTASGKRTYCLIYRADRRQRRLTVGNASILSLADARQKARDALRTLALGSDPMATRAEERQDTTTFGQVCDGFVKDQSADWRPSTRKGWVRYIDKEIKPVLSDLLPEQVTPDRVRDLIDGIRTGVPGTGEKGSTIWKRRPAPVSARRCYEVLRRLCAWAVWKRYLPISPCDQAKPFERKKSGKGRSARSKPYTDEQLRTIFTHSKGTELEHALALVARTGVRSHEARSARWEDFDLDRSLWRVPPAMHKTGDETGVPHLVTLTKGVRRVLDSIRRANLKAGLRDSPWLFPASTSSCEVCGMAGHMDKPNKVTAAVKTAAGISDRGLLHRFRDTIKTRMSEHSISERVSEHILGHVVPGIMGTYDHADMLPQRRAASTWWDSELGRILRRKAARPAQRSRGMRK